MKTVGETLMLRGMRRELLVRCLSEGDKKEDIKYTGLAIKRMDGSCTNRCEDHMWKQMQLNKFRRKRKSGSGRRVLCRWLLLARDLYPLAKTSMEPGSEPGKYLEENGAGRPTASLT
jgi:hypothetical protein